MCVILYKPGKENELPSRETLLKMFQRNRDGAGYMFPLDDGIYVRRGFFNFTALMASIEANEDKWRNRPLIIHFRIASVGSIDAANTHPYPVTTDDSVMQKTRGVFRAAVAHNGTLGKTYGTQVNTRFGPSDTRVFATTVLPAMRNPQPLLDYAADATSSRFAYMQTDEKVGWKLIVSGYWHHMEDRWWASNMFWNNPPTPPPPAPTTSTASSATNFQPVRTINKGSDGGYLLDTDCGKCGKKTYNYNPCPECGMVLCTACYYEEAHSECRLKIIDKRNEGATVTALTNILAKQADAPTGDLCDTQPLLTATTSSAA